MNSKSLVSGSADSGAYTDLNRLSSLKHGDRDSDANVRNVKAFFATRRAKFDTKVPLAHD